MLDKGKFMELLASIVEIAKTQENTISQDEIKQYFKDMELQEEQYDHIYEYLAANEIKVKGFLNSKIKIDDESEKLDKESENEEKDSIYLEMYLEELKEIEQLEKQEETKLLMDLINGQDDAKKRLIEGWLIKVVEIAKRYKEKITYDKIALNKHVLIEDLIQEGNIGLLSGVEGLFGKKEMIDGGQYLKESILIAMEQMIDNNMAEDNWEHTVLAKTNLINEAVSYLAEELGRVATLEELSDFTKLSVEEIEDIRTLSLDAIKVGGGEPVLPKVKVKKAPIIKE